MNLLFRTLYFCIIPLNEEIFGTISNIKTFVQTISNTIPWVVNTGKYGFCIIIQFCPIAYGICLDNQLFEILITFQYNTHVLTYIDKKECKLLPLCKQ